MKDLINDFFEGKTTNAQEKELFSYFAREDKDIAEELREHAGLFRYLGKGLAEELRECPLPEVASPWKMRRRYVWMVTSSVAAAVALVCIVTELTRFDPYEGSYMMVNGKKTYDPRLIREQEREIRAGIEDRTEEYREIYEQIQERTREINKIMTEK